MNLSGIVAKVKLKIFLLSEISEIIIFFNFTDEQPLTVGMTELALSCNRE